VTEANDDALRIGRPPLPFASRQNLSPPPQLLGSTAVGFFLRLRQSAPVCVRGGCMPGKRNRSAPLTSAEVREIVLLWRRGARQSAIAAKFQISQARVSQLVNAKP